MHFSDVEVCSRGAIVPDEMGSVSARTHRSDNTQSIHLDAENPSSSERLISLIDAREDWTHQQDRLMKTGGGGGKDGDGQKM